MNDSIAEMFGRPPRATIEDVEPPFVHVTRRPGGHTPYDGFDLTIDEFRSETGREDSTTTEFESPSRSSSG